LIRNKVKIRITDKYRERIKVMMVLGMTLAVVAALFAEVVNVNKKISLGK
jgi:hypothetical protein